ncbi:Peroxisomal and mitochondrial division factor 1, partial [Mucuna pruriens]
MDVMNGDASKIDALERENASKTHEIQMLNREIDSLRHEMAELESELSADEEARSDATDAALTKVLEESERRIAFLERETRSAKQETAESEMKVRDLELKLGVVEVRESEERCKRVTVQEEMRDVVAEKDREIQALKLRIHDLEKARVLRARSDALGKDGFGLMWPLVAAGSGAVAALFYFCFRKHFRH